MRMSLRRAMAASLTALSVAASLSLTASPAQAYKNSELTIKTAWVDTRNCERLAGNLTVVAYSNGCKLNDSADGTFFKKDKGGVALKMEIHHKGRMVAKAEFHPYGEWLWVYDTANDSDTIYVAIEYRYSGHNWHDGGTHRPPGTSKVVEYKKVQIPMDEGANVFMSVWDNRGYDLLHGMHNGTS